LQEYLQETAAPRIIIPYAQTLAHLIPPAAVRLRRDFTAILHLVKAHTILHQATRDRHNTALVATWEDYAAVRELTADLVAEQVGAAVSTAVREAVAAVRTLSTAATPVSMAELARHFQVDRTTAKRRVDRALEGGFLRNEETLRGKAAKLVLGEPIPEQRAIMPTVAALQAAVARVAPVTASGGISPPSSEPVQVDLAPPEEGTI